MARFRKNDFFKWTQLLIFKAKIIKKKENEQKNDDFLLVSL